MHYKLFTPLRGKVRPHRHETVAQQKRRIASGWWQLVGGSLLVTIGGWQLADDNWLVTIGW